MIQNKDDFTFGKENPSERKKWIGIANGSFASNTTYLYLLTGDPQG